MTFDRKVLSAGDVRERFGKPRSEVVVFTNGVFDLVHRGHIQYLTTARAMGDLLVVGVNSDASVRRLEKGNRRPVVGQADRAFVVAALECVDYVCVFDEATHTKLIEDCLLYPSPSQRDGLLARKPSSA